MLTLALGDNHQLGTEVGIVVRILHSESLFQEGELLQLVDERYAELKMEKDGRPEFVQISKLVREGTKTSHLNALDTAWRPK